MFIAVYKNIFVSIFFDVPMYVCISPPIFHLFIFVSTKNK